jgi:predicted ribonuclease YlaK
LESTKNANGDRRGYLASRPRWSGVVIRKDKITLRTLAVEPDFDNPLSWLDRANNDDRILTGFIEVLRQHSRCPVFLVTGDINLTNKADYTGLPCVPPPEPPGTCPTAC